MPSAQPPSLYYQVVRHGVPYAAAHYRVSGEFVQVFPFKAVYAGKNEWLSMWTTHGDEKLLVYVRGFGGASTRRRYIPFRF
jgi:hypothetical protein